MTPRISVLMPVWNGEKYLASAVESILSQSFADFEFIIVDDGSDDDTWRILAGFKDPRIRVFGLTHGGLVPALSFGLNKARGDWIARQDADDISLPQRLEAQWTAANQEPETVLCHSDVEPFGEGQAAGHARFPRTQAMLGLRLCFQCAIVHSTVLFKRQSALAAGGYLDADRAAGEDYSLWGRLMELGGCIGISEKLLQFRCHAESTSKRLNTAMIAAAQRLGTEHCRRFMRLSPEQAARANAVLVARGRQRRWRDWAWFLSHCAPRLRWKSSEMYSWLAWQTLKTLMG